MRHATLLLICLTISTTALADGKIVPPRNYKGSLEEKAQEAIIIYNQGSGTTESTQDLILKIRVAGSADQFAWVVPFPNEPKAARENAKLFQELFQYVDARKRYRPKKGKFEQLAKGAADTKPNSDVEVLSRKVVGNYDIAVVREKKAGSLNKWLTDEGYQSLENAEDVIGFYRKKGYVFACMKVTDVALKSGKPVELHPLRFTFETGGKDGIYFPMKMTGLQSEPFNVNLYVFYRYWLNDKLSKYGYVHRGFRLNYRDWDSSKCTPNGGKAWSAPQTDPFLGSMTKHIPTVAKFFQKRHPGKRYYLTNISAFGLNPADVRDWTDDLWMFPYYTNRSFVPYDARPDGPAADGWK